MASRVNIMTGNFEFPHSSLAYGAFGRDFIAGSAKGDQPFCLSISFKAPHKPAAPDRRFDEIYRGKTFTKPANFGREHGRHFAPQSREGRQFERFHSWNYSDKSRAGRGGTSRRKLQGHYDEFVARWKREAVPFHDYQRFGEIFDRSVEWDAKPRPKKKGSR
jgi:hypothetical protein